jgi:CTD kinase subunit beta
MEGCRRLVSSLCLITLRDKLMESYRTSAPLSYPPHLVAVAAIYASALLSLETADPSTFDASQATPESKRYKSTVDQLSTSGTWEEDYATTADLVDGQSPFTRIVTTDKVEVTHYLLDLYITVQSLPQTQMSNPSPDSPSGKPASTTATSSGNTAFPIPAYWTAQTLTELKIFLRNKRPGRVDVSSWPMFTEEEGDVEQSPADGIGRNEGTVRFLWDESQVEA